MRMIIYRSFLQGKTSIFNAQKVIKNLVFSKKSSSGTCGIYIKALLLRSLINKDDYENNTIYDGLKTILGSLSKEEALKFILHGCNVWMIFKKIL
jgi:hypothetical protein